MNTVQKKSRQHRPVSRWLVLALALAVLAGTAACWHLLDMQPATETPASAVTYDELIVHQPADVRSLTVTQHDKEPWTLLQDADGRCVLSGHEDWLLDDNLISSLMSVASVISYEKVLTDDPADYIAHLDDFGLEEPLLITETTYNDGTAATMRIGTPIQGIDISFVYMLLDGDDRLFALDKGTFDALNIDVSLLHTVTQPVIHKARIDRITLTDAAGLSRAEWMLHGSITDADAAAQWYMTAPCRYPADVDALNNLRENLSNLRLGAFVCEATPDALNAYGFTQPEFVMTIHQAEGMTNSINAAGEVEFVTWPDSTFTLTVGKQKNSNVDYVLVDGCIYTASHFTLDVFMNLTPLDTLSRYPVNVAAGVLEEMTVTHNGAADIYRIIRETEATAEGSVSRISAMLNGHEISYDAFEAAYIRLLTARISGMLPNGWTPEEAPHTVFTFSTVSGQTQTVELTSFDALHDAVLIDGNAVFYIIKNGLHFSMTAQE